MKIFIAIEPSEHVKSKIFHEFENLQKRNWFKGKFVEKQNIHLTLKFIGDVSQEKVLEIQKRLKEIKFEKFNCEVGKAGVFDNEKFIKVIWVGLVSDKLSKLQKQIAEKFPEFSSDNKGFNSHITTARVNSVVHDKDLMDALKKISFKNLNFDVEEFVLMKSEISKQKGEGPKYKVLEKFKAS
ncbi:MAG: RNA 2',3'-cyclic phosphodiesterase [Nanoarchaeota archaeon]